MYSTYKSGAAKTEAIQRNRFSSTLNARHITLLFVPSGSLFVKKGNCPDDLYSFPILGNVTEIEGSSDAKQAQSKQKRYSLPRLCSFKIPAL